MVKGTGALLVPVDEVTAKGPVVAPFGTCTLMKVPSALTLASLEGTPLNLTPAGTRPAKWTPEILTRSFGDPKAGETSLIKGPVPMRVKFAAVELTGPESRWIESG